MIRCTVCTNTHTTKLLNDHPGVVLGTLHFSELVTECVIQVTFPPLITHVCDNERKDMPVTPKGSGRVSDAHIS